MISVAMSPAQFANAKAELAQQGIALSGDSGVISARDCTAMFGYNGEMLVVTVTHAPLGMRAEAESRIKAALLASMAG